MIKVCVSFVVLMLSSVSWSGETRKSAATPNVVMASGRVFLITQGGDLKPARLSKVYFLYSGSLQHGAEDNTATSVFISAQASRFSKGSDELKAGMKYDGGSGGNERLICLTQLAAVDEGLMATIDWVRANKRLKEIVISSTDEDGWFRAKVPFGIYDLVVRGRAGANDAYWATHTIVISNKSRVEE